MGRRIRAMIVTSFLGPTGSWILAVAPPIVASGMDTSSSESIWTPYFIAGLVAVGLWTTIVGAAAVLPGAALAAVLIIRSGIRTRWPCILMGLVLGPLYFGGFSLLERAGAISSRFMLPTTDNPYLLVATAISGALCGEVYWRMAIRGRREGNL